MSLMDITIVIVAIVNLFLGIWVYYKKRKNPSALWFSFLTYSIVIWCLSIVLGRLIYEERRLLFAVKMIYASGFFISVIFFYFVNIFTQFAYRPKKDARLVACIPSAVLFLLIFFTDYIITSAEIILKQEKVVIFGPLYPLYFLLVMAYFTAAFYLLIRNYHQSAGTTRLQVYYVFIGTLIATIVALATNLFLPTLGYFWLGWTLGPLSTIIMVGFIAYAIIKYRLMDIRLAMGKGAVYVFSFLSVIAAAFLMIFLNNQLAQPISFNFFFPSVIIASVLLFKLFFWFFEKIGSKYFYYTFYSYQKVLTELGEKLTRILDLNQLADDLLGTLQETMKLDRTVILQRKEKGDYAILKNIGFQEENGISLVRDNFLTKHLEKTGKPLVYEELNLAVRDIHHQEEKEKLEELKKNMKKIEAAVCLPLFREKKIIGMIVLGNKISGDAYSQQDLELLTTLSSQASIAFQNAVLYSQVQDLSQNLQQKVEEQTKELREAYEELKVLDKAKTEFISIASHQLRSPLTTIKGYISMLLEEHYGELPRRAKGPIASLYQSNERLIELVNGLLNISRIETGKIAVKRQPVLIESVISSSLEELKPQAQIKKIYLKFEKPKTKIPQAWADKDKLKEVLLNVIDNGIRYTNKGGITIKLKIKNQKLKIIISDTGEGMTKEELGKIFQTFSRGRAGARFWVEGVGLGLYIAKRFTELQGGKIWAESEGKGKGSTFYVELPIK